MTKGPKGVTQKHNRLPARPPHADPLQVYCPDLEQWARSSSYEPRDTPPGLQMVEYFKPFLRHLLTLRVPHARPCVDTATTCGA